MSAPTSPTSSDSPIATGMLFEPTYALRDVHNWRPPIRLVAPGDVTAPEPVRNFPFTTAGPGGTGIFPAFTSNGDRAATFQLMRNLRVRIPPPPPNARIVMISPDVSEPPSEVDLSSDDEFINAAVCGSATVYREDTTASEAEPPGSPDISRLSVTSPNPADLPAALRYGTTFPAPDEATCTATQLLSQHSSPMFYAQLERTGEFQDGAGGAGDAGGVGDVSEGDVSEGDAADTEGDEGDEGDDLDSDGIDDRTDLSEDSNPAPAAVISTSNILPAGTVRRRAQRSCVVRARMAERKFKDFEKNPHLYESDSDPTEEDSDDVKRSRKRRRRKRRRRS